MMRRILLLVFCFLSFTIFAAEPVTLMGLNIRPAKTFTRIIFIMSKKTSGTVKYIPNPDRITIDLENTSKRFNIQNARLGSSNVTSINTEEPGNGVLRFIFHLNGQATWKIQFLPKNGNTVRLQLDIISDVKKNWTTSEAKESILLADLIDQQLSESTWLIGRARLEQAKLIANKPHMFTVVIDPGHGGKDPGAIGVRGAEEKNVVLSIARRLAKEINQEKNMRAVLTRSGDYYVSLRGRMKLAHKGNADLFISIHADAYFDDNATGASVYALSQHGATSEAARWLAQRDNYSELGGVEFDNLKDHSPLLRSVLIDLAQTATIQDSMRLGNKVLDAFEQVTTLHYPHVEQAPFMVLKSPDIPSILVETGFITNPKEEARLSGVEYQQKIATALRLGVKGYISKYGLT